MPMIMSDAGLGVVIGSPEEIEPLVIHRDRCIDVFTR